MEIEFSIDFIIKRIQLLEDDKSNLSVDVTFDNDIIKISSSQFDKTKQNVLIVKVPTLDDFMKKIKDKPLNLKVNFNNDQEYLGNCTIVWSTNIVNEITEKTDCIVSYQVDIINNGDVLGQLFLDINIIQKHIEFQNGNTSINHVTGSQVISDLLKDIVNLDDEIFFVIGENVIDKKSSLNLNQSDLEELISVQSDNVDSLLNKKNSIIEGMKNKCKGLHCSTNVDNETYKELHGKINNNKNIFTDFCCNNSTCNKIKNANVDISKKNGNNTINRKPQCTEIFGNDSNDRAPLPQKISLTKIDHKCCNPNCLYAQMQNYPNKTNLFQHRKGYETNGMNTVNEPCQHERLNKYNLCMMGCGDKISNMTKTNTKLCKNCCKKLKKSISNHCFHENARKCSICHQLHIPEKNPSIETDKIQFNNISPNMKWKYDTPNVFRNVLQDSNDNLNICKHCSNYSAKESDNSRRRLLTKKKLKKNKEHFVYNFGARYPRSIKQRHKKCNADSKLVPKNMGWLWNIKTYGIDKVRKGWRPGAVTKPIKELMTYFLDSYPCDTLPTSGTQYKTKKEYKSKSDEPTMVVQKRNGEYTIILNPINNKHAMKDSSSKNSLEQIPMIIKLKDISDDVKSHHRIKQTHSKCICGKPKCNCICNGKTVLRSIKTRVCKDYDKNYSSNDECDDDFDIVLAAPTTSRPCKSYVTEATQYDVNDVPFSNGINAKKSQLDKAKKSEKSTKLKLKKNESKLKTDNNKTKGVKNLIQEKSNTSNIKKPLIGKSGVKIKSENNGKLSSKTGDISKTAVDKRKTNTPKSIGGIGSINHGNILQSGKIRPLKNKIKTFPQITGNYCRTNNYSSQHYRPCIDVCNWSLKMNKSCYEPCYYSDYCTNNQICYSTPAVCHTICDY